MYKANVRRILTEGEGDQLRAVGVQLLDGRTFKGQVQLLYVVFTLRVAELMDAFLEHMRA